MEFRYSIQPHNSLLRLHCAGPVTASGLIAMMRHIASDSQYRPGLQVLADCREASGEWDYSEVQSVRDRVVRIGRRFSGVRWGAVMSAGTLVAACHVMILITDPQECGIHMRLFEDPDVAEAWVLAGAAPGTQPVALQA